MLTNCCASFIGVSRAKNMHAHVPRSRLLPNRACQTALDSIPPLAPGFPNIGIRACCVGEFEAWKPPPQELARLNADSA